MIDPAPLSRPFVMVDEPSPFDALATWEQHLKEMEALPDETENKADLIASAKQWIAKKMGG